MAAHQVLIGLGSNIEPEYYLTAAAKTLRTWFADIVFSSVYRSAAVGMDGDDFLNACARFSCLDSRLDLEKRLKILEDMHGRDRSQGSWKPRTLDLDILMMDGKPEDDDIYRYAHIYVPALDIMPLDLNGDVRFDLVGKVDVCL